MIFFLSSELFCFLRNSYEAELEKMDAENVRVDIATYGISLYDDVIDEFRQKSAAAEFLECISGTGNNTRLVVGIPPKKRFEGASYGLNIVDFHKRAREIQDLGNAYGITAVAISESHLKMYRINDIYVVGGINFSNSRWTDCSVVITDKSDKIELQEIFDCTFKRATVINPINKQCSLSC